MKKSKLVSLTITANKICFLIILFVLLLNLNTVKSQDRLYMLYPSIGIGGGVPKATAESYYYSTPVFGSGYEVKGGLTFRMKRFDITSALEYGYNAKSNTNTNTYSGIWRVTSNKSNESKLTRISPAITANLYIPVGSSAKNALFVALGTHYDFLKYNKNWTATAIGLKLAAGISAQSGIVNAQPYISYSFSNNALSNTYYVDGQAVQYELSYSYIMFGLNVSLHRPMGYR